MLLLNQALFSLNVIVGVALFTVTLYVSVTVSKFSLSGVNLTVIGIGVEVALTPFTTIVKLGAGWDVEESTLVLT